MNTVLHSNETWFLWVRYCSFYPCCCPQWDDSSRQSAKNLTLSSWHWEAKTFWGSWTFSSCEIQLWACLWMAPQMGRISKIPGLFWCEDLPWHAAGAWNVLISCKGTGSPDVLVGGSLQGWKEKVCSRSSHASLSTSLLSCKNTAVTFTNLGSGEVRGQLQQMGGVGRSWYKLLVVHKSMTMPVDEFQVFSGGYFFLQ